jgi:rod shape-determining protein MreB
MASWAESWFWDCGGVFCTHAAIDLGTANTHIYVDGRGLIAVEPSVIAIHTGTRKVEAIGERAKQMLGRTPAHLIALRPLQTGAIADIDLTQIMISMLLGRAGRGRLRRWKVAVAVPSNLTDVERHAVTDALRRAGAADVQLVEHILAAAVGAGLPVEQSRASMVVDIGAGVTEAAVMSLGGVVMAKSEPIGGDTIDDGIREYLRATRRLLVGVNTAEQLKIGIGSVAAAEAKLGIRVAGQNSVTGLPDSSTVSSEEIRPILLEIAMRTVELIRSTIDSTAPELAADLIDSGIVFTGGGSLLRGIPALVSKELGVPARVAAQPVQAGVLGASRMLRMCFQTRSNSVRYREMLATAARG